MDIDLCKMTFARALFDNSSDMPRELSFKKGDILTILQERYDNNSEWWICSLRNVVGLAPANRLEEIPVLVPNKPTFQSQISASPYDELPDQSASNQNYLSIPLNDDSYSTYQLPKEDIYVDPLRNSRSIDDHSLYQFPTNSNLDNTTKEETYMSYTNTPNCNTLRPLSFKESIPCEYYNDRYDYSDSFSDAASSSLTGSSIHSANNFSLTSSDSGVYRSIQKDATPQLNMSQEDGIAKYRQLQNETTLCCKKVIDFVKAKWKSEEMLKTTINSIHECFVDFNDNLIVLATFAIGVYKNSENSSDVNLTKKLAKHVSPLQESMQIVKESLAKLETMNWEPENIAMNVRLAVREEADALGHVVSAARIVLINIRSLSVTINGNASILFSQSCETSSQNEEADLVMKPDVDKDRDDNGRHVQSILKLFGQQVKSQVELVNETVDDFIAFISRGNKNSHFQETLTSNSKFVVRGATQLVCIAKNLSDTNINSVPCKKIEDVGNKLCDSLKMIINITKQLISDPRWSKNQKDQLLSSLSSVKSYANNLQSIVVRSLC